MQQIVQVFFCNDPYVGLSIPIFLFYIVSLCNKLSWNGFQKILANSLTIKSIACYSFTPKKELVGNANEVRIEVAILFT